MPANPQFIEKWVHYLNDVDREMSCIAAQKLGATKDSSVIPALVAALMKNRPDDVRISIIRALGTIGHVSAIKSLIPLLKDNSATVATTAANAMGEINHPSCVAPLTEVVQTYKQAYNRHSQLHSGTRGVYIAALSALERIGTSQAREVVEKYGK